MPYLIANGVSIYYEVHGQGFPLVWSHELSGDYRSWEPQVRFFSRRYQVITYNARGYPPSGVPTKTGDYGQGQSVDDLKELLDSLGVAKAHIGGLSMGGNVALNFGIKYPKRSASVIAAATGSGSVDPAMFRSTMATSAATLALDGMEDPDLIRGSMNVQLLRKDPKGWEEFARNRAEHSGLGTSLTMRGVQGKRPTVFELESKLRSLQPPTLILVGDEDDACIEPSLFMKRCIPNSGLAMFPRSGHPINLEEPDLFNRTVLDFLSAVDIGQWAGPS